MTTPSKTWDTAAGGHRCELENGQYTPTEALEIINHLIETRLNFLKLRDFSHQVRFDGTDEQVLQAIALLRENKASVYQAMQEAARTGKSVNVRSNITITLS